MTRNTSPRPPSDFEQAVRQIAERPRVHPRRPFKARGSFVRRCEGCRMPQDYCLCSYRTEVASLAQFWVLMHPEEVNKPTNTARLIGDTLPATRVFAWDRMEPPAALLALLQDPQYQPFIIFPDDQPDYQHRVVEFESARIGQEARRPVFILLDGTWRQARRMFRKSPWLDALPVLPLRTEQKTGYRLRKPASEQHLCTAEVGIELLKLAGDLQAAEVLQQYFTVFNEGYGAARHQRPSGLTEAMQWLLDYQASSASR